MQPYNVCGTDGQERHSWRVSRAASPEAAIDHILSMFPDLIDLHATPEGEPCHCNEPSEQSRPDLPVEEGGIESPRGHP